MNISYEKKKEFAQFIHILSDHKQIFIAGDFMNTAEPVTSSFRKIQEPCR